MEAVLLIDFGSTNTKVTAVAPDAPKLLGTATAFTTVATDIGQGLKEAIFLLEKETGPLGIVKRFACSSAAGGLKMIASGLVPSLTAEAARLAALGAGAKVISTFSYELTTEDIREIAAKKPDIFLLTGGVDGGNRDCILHNAEILSGIPEEQRFPVIIAGNRSAAAECQKLLSEWHVIRCANVLPSMGKLNIAPVQEEIRKVFLERIIHGRGLSREKTLISGILMPTPSAVKAGLDLLSAGAQDETGFGEIVAVDLGGATTDVYSVASGKPLSGDVVVKGIPEPFSKRTVEGDIGMRYSASGILEAVGAEYIAALAGVSAEAVPGLVSRLTAAPETLPQTQEDYALDFALAAAAVETAVARHSGTLEEVYTPTGLVFVQAGKDLRGVDTLVLTGGALIHAKQPKEIAAYACYAKEKGASLRPAGKVVYMDASYILAAMGLLGVSAPKVALAILKQELKRL